MEGRGITFKHKLPIARTNRYWSGLEEGKIHYTICKACGTKYYPPQADCSRCFSTEMKWVELEGEGTIECFAQVNALPEGFKARGKPYTVLIASFGECKVMGWFDGDELPAVGMKVKAYAKKNEDGVLKVYFRPSSAFNKPPKALASP